MAMPHIWFVLNQQAQTETKDLFVQLRQVIKKIVENPMYAGENIEQHIQISEQNVIILPSAFNHE